MVDSHLGARESTFRVRDVVLCTTSASVTAMIDTIEIPQPRDGGSLHALVGRSVSVRNHYEKSGLCHASDIYGDGGVPGAGRYLDGVIVAEKGAAPLLIHVTLRVTCVAPEPTRMYQPSCPVFAPAK